MTTWQIVGIVVYTLVGAWLGGVYMQINVRYWTQHGRMAMTAAFAVGWPLLVASALGRAAARRYGKQDAPR